ncbi:MAG: hypothetical protein NZ518_10585, partial [Dehalococcoidia bacterium]|nr:hypothetical protein [Dehalococcoidia bacterium]
MRSLPRGWRLLATAVALTAGCAAPSAPQALPFAPPTSTPTAPPTSTATVPPPTATPTPTAPPTPPPQPFAGQFFILCRDGSRIVGAGIIGACQSRGGVLAVSDALPEP